MTQKLPLSLYKLGRCALLSAVMLMGITARATAQRLYGIANPSAATPLLVSFDAAAPGTLLSAVTIAALGGQTLIGIETHPLTGELYALGYTPASQRSQLYKLDPTTGVLTATSLSLTVNLGNNLARMGFTFSPATGRLRLTGSNGQNYSVDPANVASFSFDGSLAYASTDANAGQQPSLCSWVYTMGTDSTLYGLDAGNNRLVTLGSPNDGMLRTSAALTGFSSMGLGQYNSLGLKPAEPLGTSTVYLVTATGGSATAASTLYTLNLSTGVVTPVGPVGSAAASLVITDIAVGADKSVVTAMRASELAIDYSLFPNPLSSTTNLHFGLSRATHVELVVSDALGRTIETVKAGQLPAGSHTLQWSRVGQAAGLYFFSLRFDGRPAGTRPAILTY